MAVTLTIDDLKQPIGELDESLFPDGNIDTLLAGWLDQAANQVNAAAGIATADQDDAAAGWVYYRAYTQIADRLASQAESITVGPRTERTSTGQQKYFADKAKYWLDWYYGLFTLTQTASAPAFFTTVKANRYPVWRY